MPLNDLLSFFNQPDMARDILTQRFQPTAQDVGNAALAGIGGGTYVSPQSYSDGRMKEMMQQMALMNTMQRTNVMSQGGQTGALIDRFMAANPGASVSDAISFVKSPGQGNTFANGQVQPLTGAPQAAGAMAYGKEAGQRGAEMDTAAGIEKQKKIGQGEITDVEKKATGQGQLDVVTDDIINQFVNLNKTKGIVNPSNTAGENLIASVKQSGAGQFVQSIVGSPEQTLRNNIKSMEPLLINSIRQATGQSAKAMDSNAELNFYRMAVKAGDLPSQIAAIDRIRKMYGSPTGKQGGPVNIISDSAPETKTINGVTYTKIDGVWHQ
jgi:hypothetical protein